MYYEFNPVKVYEARYLAWLTFVYGKKTKQKQKHFFGAQTHTAGTAHHIFSFNFSKDSRGRWGLPFCTDI